jgi:hypothetical protein
MNASALLTPHVTQAAADVVKQLIVSVADTVKHKQEHPDPAPKSGNQTVYGLINTGLRNNEPKKEEETSNFGINVATGATIGLSLVATLAGGAYVANRIAQNSYQRQNEEARRRRQQYTANPTGRVFESKSNP